MKELVFILALSGWVPDESGELKKWALLYHPGKLNHGFTTLYHEKEECDNMKSKIELEQGSFIDKYNLNVTCLPLSVGVKPE